MENIKLKICLITISTQYHRIGGMENHIFNLVEGLRKKGHKVWILTPELDSSIKINEFQVRQPFQRRNLRLR